MIKKRKSTNNFSTILSSFIILFLVVGVVGFLFIHTDNFTTTYKNFKVVCGGEEFLTDRDNFNIYVGKEYKFEIKTNISFNEDEEKNKYNVSVIPNDAEYTNFKFNVGTDAVEKEFATMESLSRGFSIIPYEDYFLFTANLELNEIISLYYNEINDLTVIPTAFNSGRPYFCLLVQSGDLSEEIRIYFNLKSE